MSTDLFTPRPVFMARMNADRFTDEFMAYLPDNIRVYEAFEREALRVVARGRTHYSARTLIEVLRHESALAEQGGSFKLSDWHTPYLARLFVLLNPGYPDLFEFRVTKPQREGVAA